MKTPKDHNQPSPDSNYEENLKNLEKIIQTLENDNPSLNELVSQYEKGMEYYRSCEKLLREAELKIEQIRRENRDQAPEKLSLPEEPTP